MEGATTITGAFTAAVGSLATQISDGLIALIPVLLPIMGTLILVSILVRVIQRVTGRRA